MILTIKVNLNQRDFLCQQKSPAETKSAGLFRKLVIKNHGIELEALLILVVGFTLTGVSG